MMDNIDDVPKKRFRALKETKKEKLQVTKLYNKNVTKKSFQVNDLVWKMILPSGMRSNRFGKWSPS
jgi:hypothetical protein